jgi:hypothetical protein
MKSIKSWARPFLLVTFLFVLPGLLMAGGDLQEKIKQKISGSKNIQYNLEGPQQQYDSYYPQNEPESNLAVDVNKKVNSLREDRDSLAKLQRTQITEASVLSAYAIYKTNYKAEIEEDVVTVKGNVLFEVFKKGWTQIPLVKSNVGLIDVSINRGASFVAMQGGKYYLMIDKPGKYTLDIEFLVKAARERENGPGNFSFETVPSPISQFEFAMPESGVEIFVDPSIKLEVTREAKKTVAWAVMPNTSNITVRWTKALPKETIAPVKLEPKVYVDTASYAAVGEGLIRCTSSLNYSILQSEVSNLRIALPEDITVLEVRGNDLRDWKVSVKDKQQYLDVYFNFGVKGNYLLILSYERKIGEGSVVASIPSIRAVGVEREKGYVGVAAATNVELAQNKVERVTAIDVKELPSSIWSSTANPILLAFKYSSHPFSIAIDVTRHEEVPVLVAAIDFVDYVTLQTEEGKSLTKATYQVRNNVKQFIHFSLPKTATLWSVFVAGKPVKPAKDKNANMLVPLEKSQLSGESLSQFPVEIVYLDQGSKMGLIGGIKFRLPQTDIPISRLNWSVYLPYDFAYFNFGGDVKQAKERSGIFSQVSSGINEEMKDYGRIRGATQLASQTMSQQAQIVVDQFHQSAQMKGILPIKIDIPNQGRLYHFSKLLVTENESPWLSLNFVVVFKQLRWIFWLGILAIGILFFKKRARIKKIGKAQ